MTAKVRDWLPADVAVRPAVRERVAAAIDAWAADWFAPRRLAANDLTVASRRRPVSDEGSWRLRRATTAIAASDRALQRVTGWALDVRLEEQTSTDADRKLLEDFQRRFLDDLAERVERSLGIDAGASTPPAVLPHPLDDLGGVTVAVGDARDETLLSIAISLGAVLPFCRTCLPARAANAPALKPLMTAAAPTIVALQSVLGVADISVADLRDLAPGDVLVLGRALTDPLDLVMAGAETPVARARLADADGRMTLVLQA